MSYLREESHLAGYQFDIPWSQSHCRISHDLCFYGAQASCGTGLNKAVQHHVQQVGYLNTVRKLEVKSSTFELFKLRVWSTHLAQATPDLGLDGGIHLLFVDRHGDEFVQNGSDTLALGVVIVLTEANQVEQPGCHVLQAEMLQLDTCNRNTIMV